MTKLFFFAAMLVVATLPSYATIEGVKVAPAPNPVSPIAVWISCNGKPIALVLSTSQGYFAGDVMQINDIIGKKEFFDALDEAANSNTLANIDIGKRDWISCTTGQPM